MVPTELLHDVTEPVQLRVAEDPRVVVVELADLVRVVPHRQRLELLVQVPQSRPRAIRPPLRQSLVRGVPVPLVEVLVAIRPGVVGPAPAVAEKSAVGRQLLLLLFQRLLLQLLLDGLELPLHLLVVVPKHDGREVLLVGATVRHLPVAEHGLKDEVVLEVAQAPVAKLVVEVWKLLVRGELGRLHGVDHVVELLRGRPALGPGPNRASHHRVRRGCVFRDVHLLSSHRLDPLVRPSLILLGRGSRLRGVGSFVVDGSRGVAVPLDVLLEVDELGVGAFLAGSAGGELVLGHLAVSFADSLDVIFPGGHEHGAAALAHLPEMPGVVVPLVRVESELAELPAFLAAQALAPRDRPVRSHHPRHVGPLAHAAHLRHGLGHGVVEHGAVVDRLRHDVPGVVIVVLAHPHLRAVGLGRAGRPRAHTGEHAVLGARRRLHLVLVAGPRHERVRDRILLVDELLDLLRHRGRTVLGRRVRDLSRVRRSRDRRVECSEAVLGRNHSKAVRLGGAAAVLAKGGVGWRRLERAGGLPGGKEAGERRRRPCCGHT